MSSHNTKGKEYPVPLLNRLRFQLFDFSVPCTHCLLPLASHPEFRCVHS